MSVGMTRSSSVGLEADRTVLLSGVPTRKASVMRCCSWSGALLNNQLKRSSMSLAVCPPPSLHPMAPLNPMAEGTRDGTLAGGSEVEEKKSSSRAFSGKSGVVSTVGLLGMTRVGEVVKSTGGSSSTAAAGVGVRTGLPVVSDPKREALVLARVTPLRDLFLFLGTIPSRSLSDSGLSPDFDEGPPGLPLQALTRCLRKTSGRANLREQKGQVLAWTVSER